MDTIALGITLVGLLGLLFGLYTAYRLRDLLQTGKLKKAWDLLSVFIVGFLLFYVAFLAQMMGYLFDFQMQPTSRLLVSLIFLGGGLFVAATAYLNRNVFE